jgi:hypothetical protein
MVNYIILSAVRHPQVEVGSIIKLERRCPHCLSYYCGTLSLTNSVKICIIILVFEIH